MRFRVNYYLLQWMVSALRSQEYQDDTMMLRQAVHEAGGLEKLQDQRTLRSALICIDPLLSEAR